MQQASGTNEKPVWQHASPKRRDGNEDWYTKTTFGPAGSCWWQTEIFCLFVFVFVFVFVCVCGIRRIASCFTGLLLLLSLWPSPSQHRIFLLFLVNPASAPDATVISTTSVVCLHRGSGTSCHVLSILPHTAHTTQHTVHLYTEYAHHVLLQRCAETFSRAYTKVQWDAVGVGQSLDCAGHPR